MGGGEPTTRPWLDEEILGQLRRVGGEDLIQELMRLFITHAPERVRRARRALARGDLERAAKAVHSLRSASATLGARELADSLRGIESAAERGDAETVGRGWPEVEDRVAALLGHLEERLDQT